jgi:FkbM family methyltransferase
MEALGGVLRHYDRAQLLFQLTEVVAERTYLKHGIELREGEVVLDVGANVGVAAAFFASECKAGAVHCFEPVPPIFELLRENVRQWPACVTHSYGLSAAAGCAQITFYPDSAAMSGFYADPKEDEARVRTYLINAGMSGEAADRQLAGRYKSVTFMCQLRTLSEVLRQERIEQVHLLKLDVEKAELDVLRGIQESDWRRISQVAAEVHGDAELADMSEALDRRGFSVVAEQAALWKASGLHMLYARRP